MNERKLLNWSEVSRQLSGNRSSIRGDVRKNGDVPFVPKYQRQINHILNGLVKLVEEAKNLD